MFFHYIYICSFVDYYMSSGRFLQHNTRRCETASVAGCPSLQGRMTKLNEQVKSLQRMVWRLQKQNTRTSKARNKSAREAAPDVPSQDVATPVKDQHEGQQEPEDGEGDVHVEYAIGDYVANIDDEEYEINFMESIP